MGVIRSQSIKSSFVTYIGFAFGALNSLLFAKYVDPSVYGLTRVMFGLGMIFYSLSTLGSVSMMNKFYPYYRDHLEPPKRDIFGIVLMMSGIGFLLVTGGSYIFHDLIVRKFSQNSKLFVDNFYLMYPFTFFLLLFTLFENYSYNQFRSIFPVFLKEVLLRCVTTLILAFTIYKALSIQGFLYSFTFIYCIIFIILLIYLLQQRTLHFTFSLSKLTKRISNKLISFTSLIFGGTVFVIISQNIDSLFISSMKGLNYTGVFEFSTYISNVIQVPQRSVINIAVPVLAKAWKDKDLGMIQRIYTRSSLTLLIYALVIFALIWMNLEDVYNILGLPDIYFEGKYVIFFLCLSKVTDLGTGVNSQAIGTSNHWRFEFFSTLFLIIMSIPMNYLFIKWYGITGSGVAQLISIVLFNFIRWIFLYKKYNLQPFSRKTLYVLLMALGIYLLMEFTITFNNPYLRVILKSVIFVTLFLGGILFFRLSEDLTVTHQQVMDRYRRFRNK